MNVQVKTGPVFLDFDQDRSIWKCQCDCGQSMTIRKKYEYDKFASFMNHHKNYC